MIARTCDRAKTVWGYADSVWHCTREKHHNGPCALKPGNRYEEIPTPAPRYGRPTLTEDDVKAIFLMVFVVLLGISLAILGIHRNGW